MPLKLVGSILYNEEIFGLSSINSLLLMRYRENVTEN